MIVVDTSAVVAIAFGEPERQTFLRVLHQANRALISTVSVVEARMVVHGRRGQRAVVLLDDVLRLPMFEIVAPGPAEMDAAYAAFVAFGKGSSMAKAPYKATTSCRWSRGRCSRPSSNAPALAKSPSSTSNTARLQRANG